MTAVVMPLHDPSQLNRERVEYWKRQHGAGVNLTAFAVSVIDNQTPAAPQPDDTYEYDEQFLFTNCVLDGHHRIQAAAELGTPVRILSLLTTEFSLVNNTDIPAVLLGYTRCPIPETFDRDQSARVSGPSPAGSRIRAKREAGSLRSFLTPIWLLFGLIVALLLIIPLVLFPFVAKIILEVQGRILTRNKAIEKLRTGQGTFVEEVDHYWVIRIWWTEDDLPECSLDPNDPVNQRIRKEYLGIRKGKALLTDLLPKSRMSPTELWNLFPKARVVRAGCWA